MRTLDHISYLHVLRAHKCLGCTRSSEIKAPPCSFIPRIGKEHAQNGKPKENVCLYQCLYKTSVKYNISLHLCCVLVHVGCILDIQNGKTQNEPSARHCDGSGCLHRRHGLQRLGSSREA